jgi:hypothetical protein
MQPLTPLDIFRKEIQYPPFPFWQLTNEKMPINNDCNTLVLEGLQMTTQALGREDIRAALVQAENMIAQFQGYDVAPRYRSETIAYSGFPLQLPHGYLHALGTEQLDLIATPNVTYLDRDSDGISETFEVTTATTVTDPSELALFFVAADRFDRHPVEVRPIDITISGGIATITGPAWLMVRPVRYHGYTAQALDPDDVTVVAQTVDVYRRTTDATNAVTIGYSDSTTQVLAAADLAIFDNRLSMIGASSLVCRTPLTRHCGYPLTMTVNYRAGYPHPEHWYKAVCALAATYLEGGICSCDTALKRLYYWRQDMNKATADQISMTQQIQLDNPLGTKIGHDLAWRVMLQYPAIRQAIAV